VIVQPHLAGSILATEGKKQNQAVSPVIDVHMQQVADEVAKPNC
jgi:hypothetical protein